MLLSSPPCDASRTAQDFTLLDVVSGTSVTLSDQSHPHGFVVAFICNHCPYVQAIITEFTEVAVALQAEQIPVYAIMSNNYEFVTEDSPDRMKEFAATHNFSFPYCVDEDQSVATAYGAVCTPDFFGFNNDHKQHYRGAAPGLLSAMQTIKETGHGPHEQRASQGCSIKWK